MFTIYDDNDKPIHKAKTLAKIRRYITRKNVSSYTLPTKRSVRIDFRDGGYLIVTYADHVERNESLNRWRNLRGKREKD